EVRHRVRFQIGTDVFHWIEFGSVCRQVLQRDRTALSLDEALDEFRSMRLQSIPDDQYLPADRGRERLQEFNDLRTFDRPGEQTKVEAMHAHPGNRGELLPAEAVL